MDSTYARPRNHWLKVLVSLALLALLVRRVDLGDTLARLRGIHLPLWLAAWLLYQTGMLIRAGRWRTLVTALGYRPGLLRLTGLYYAGAFFSTMLPTGFGGDVVKAYELAQDVGHLADATGTVLMDRWLGLLVLFIQALVVLPFSLDLVPRSVAWSIGGLGLGALLATVLLFEPAWQRRLINVLPGALARLGHKWLAISETAVHGYGAGNLARALLYSIVFNLTHVVNHWLIGLALGVQAPPGYYFLFVPLISLSLTLPISISGIGVREGAFAALFGLAGVPSEQGLAMGIAFFALQLSTAAVGGVMYAARALRGARQAPHPTGEKQR